VADFSGRRGLDPFCGSGGVGGTLRDEFGVDIICSDIIQYDMRSTPSSTFFAQSAAPAVDFIVANPPFKRAADVVRHALPTSSSAGRICGRTGTTKLRFWA
jgi:hypothetical protein